MDQSRLDSGLVIDGSAHLRKSDRTATGSIALLDEELREGYSDWTTANGEIQIELYYWMQAPFAERFRSSIRDSSISLVGRVRFEEASSILEEYLLAPIVVWLILQDNDPIGKTDWLLLALENKEDGKILYSKEGRLSAGNIEIHRTQSHSQFIIVALIAGVVTVAAISAFPTRLRNIRGARSKLG